MAPRKIDPDSPAVVVGQTRIDKRGGRLVIAAEAPGRRYVVKYPQLDMERGVLGAETIRELYPVVTDGDGAPGAVL